MYQKILSARIEWPRHFDSVSKDLIKKLLVADPTKRLGSGNCGLVSFANLHSNSSTTSSSMNTTFPPLNNTRSYRGVESSTTKKDSLVTSSTNSGYKTSGGGGGGEGVFLTEGEVVELIPLNENESSSSQTSSPLEKVASSVRLDSMWSGSQTNGTNSTSGFDHVNLKRQKITMGSEEVKRHLWFISITDWDQVYLRKLKPPFVPDVNHDGDTQNFEKYDPADFGKVPSANEQQLDHFKDF